MNTKLGKLSRKALLEDIPRTLFIKRRKINIIILSIGSLLIAVSILIIVFTIPQFTPHKSHYLVLSGVIVIFIAGVSFSILSFKKIQRKIISERINVKSLFLFYSGISIMILSLVGTFIAYIIKNLEFLHRDDIVFSSITIIVTLIISYGFVYALSIQIERALDQITKSERIYKSFMAIMLHFS